MILMNDFKAEYKYFQKPIQKAVDQTLLSGWYILGTQVKEFEKEFASFTKAKYCIGVANGLEALQISLLALGIGKGDEVITVANTAVATVLAISSVGATPVFADIDQNHHIDPIDVEKKITKKTKAILPVHLFGQSADIKSLVKIAKTHQLFIVEDACQAHGATYDSKVVGTFGELGCFSFYPTKNLGGYGDGGAIVTTSKKLYEKCQMLRNYGQKTRYVHELKGINSRLDELQAAILRVKLAKLNYLTNKRINIAKRYNQLLKDIPNIKLLPTRPHTKGVYHLYIIECEKRDQLQKFLKENGVESLIHYPIPVHKQLAYKESGKTKLPQTEQKSQTILSLPIHPFLKDTDIKKICAHIEKFYS